VGILNWLVNLLKPKEEEKESIGTSYANAPDIVPGNKVVNVTVSFEAPPRTVTTEVPKNMSAEEIEKIVRNTLECELEGETDERSFVKVDSIIVSASDAEYADAVIESDEFGWW
jgi:hypothetical protein